MTAWQANLRRRFDRAASGYEALAQLQQQAFAEIAGSEAGRLHTLHGGQRGFEFGGRDAVELSHDLATQVAAG